MIDPPTTSQLISLTNLRLDDVVEASMETISGGVLLIQVTGEDASRDITIDLDGTVTNTVLHA